MSIPYRGDPHELAKHVANYYRRQSEEISKVKPAYKIKFNNSMKI